MTTKELRDIQATGTSHDVIDAIISYLESKEKPVKETFDIPVVKEKAAKKVTKKK